MADDLHYRSLMAVSRLIEMRDLSPVELTRAMLDRVAALNPSLHAYIQVTEDAALTAARRAEDEIMQGRHRGPLHGVPIALKDLCYTTGVPTAAGTTIHAGWTPDYDATVVDRLARAGAVSLGKLQLTEGAFSQHHPSLDAPVNPWDAQAWPGGSSSGSGSATAAGLCFGSLGSDTGGSIRFPSAACGITGLKPTWGRVSRYGVFALSDTLDHIGPMTRSAEDAAAMLGVIAGADPNDPTALRAPVPNYLATVRDGIRGIRIGLDPALVSDGIEAPVAAGVATALEELRHLGAEIRPIIFPPTDEIVVGWMGLCGAEVALVHEKTYPSRAPEYGEALAGLIEIGRRISAVDLSRILIARHAFRGRLEALWEDVDLIVAPTMFRQVPTIAQMEAMGGDPEDDAKMMRFTAPHDFSGSPTITLPCGFDARGLPLSFQLIGPHLSEGLLCRAGHAYQTVTDWHLRHPPV